MPGRPGSPDSWSCGLRPGPCSSGQLSDSRAGSYGVTRTWRTPRSDTMVLFREMQCCKILCATEKGSRRIEVLPSWLQAPNIFMTCGWLTCFSKVNSDSRSRSSLWDAFSVMEAGRGTVMTDEHSSPQTVSPHRSS